MEPDAKLLERLRMKPMRTLSGVTTVTERGTWRIECSPYTE